MNQRNSGESGALIHESDRELNVSVLELVSNALETTVVIWQIEDDLVCVLRYPPAAQQDDSTPAYLDAMSARAMLHPNDHDELNAAISRCLSRQLPIVTVNLRVRTPEGWVPVMARMRGMAFDEGGHITRIVAMLHRITDTATLQALQGRDLPQAQGGMRAAARALPRSAHSQPPEMAMLNVFLAAQAQVMKMVLHGDDLQAILEDIARMVEQLAPQTLCSVLLLSEDGEHFERSAGPSLPPLFHQAIVQMTVDPATGSCGAAAYRRAPVVTTDIANDPLWRNYQSLAVPSGLAACCSRPFFGKSGQVLGTVAIYHQVPGAPDGFEMQILAAAADLAGVAVSAYIAERQIRDLSSYDALTGLPNRDRFRQLLEEELHQARRRGQAAGLLCIDLDRFRLVNESLGQKAGDALLRQAARRLRQVAGAADETARLGADEFVVLVRNPASLESLHGLAHELAQAMAEPVEIDQRVFRQTASIGLCLFPDDGDDAQALMRGADLAMSQAKAQGGNAVCHYAADMLAASVQRLALRADLPGAAQRKELTLLYQPKLDLRSGQVTGAEALVRWVHPQYGMLSPAMFIPVAETSGDIMAIGNWVLHEACRQMAAWRAAGEVMLPVAINLSARQFADPALAANIESAIRRYDLDGELLELEVTESLVIEDPARAVKILSALQAIGVRIAVDDFGTGYSSLAQLKRFPVNSLKIDRSFVQDIPGEHNDAAIVKAIIAMGHALNLKVIAEGVENADQLAFLQRHDCDAIQGYYLSQPLSVDQLQEFMRQRHATSLT
jgi:diguanylate cyclase (GGDEF)-like protein